MSKTDNPRDPHTHADAQTFQPRTDTEAATLDIPPSDAPHPGSDELDALSKAAGTTVCWWCKRRRSVAAIEDCEAPDGIGRCHR